VTLDLRNDDVHEHVQLLSGERQTGFVIWGQFWHLERTVYHTLVQYSILSGTMNEMQGIESRKPLMILHAKDPKDSL